MQRAAIGLFAALLTGGCVHGSSLEQVHAGMTQEQVVSVMGQPQSSMHTPGRDCAVYSVLKDFWSRVPWEMTNRYFVCYTDGKVDYFGRADQPETN
jgi:hypothetical protein